MLPIHLCVLSLSLDQDPKGGQTARRQVSREQVGNVCIPTGPRRCGGCRASETEGQNYKHTGQCHSSVQHRHRASFDKESVRENVGHTNRRALMGKRMSFPLSTCRMGVACRSGINRGSRTKRGRPEYKRPRPTLKVLRQGDKGECLNRVRSSAKGRWLYGVIGEDKARTYLPSSTLDVGSLNLRLFGAMQWTSSATRGQKHTDIHRVSCVCEQKQRGRGRGDPLLDWRPFNR